MSTDDLPVLLFGLSFFQNSVQPVMLLLLPDYGDYGNSIVLALFLCGFQRAVQPLRHKYWVVLILINADVSHFPLPTLPLCPKTYSDSLIHPLDLNHFLCTGSPVSF